MKYSKYSTIIVGSGISGLYAALKIEQKINAAGKVLLITKSKLGESNSYYAQGGMVAVLHENKSDSVELHINDTIKAGAGLSELETIKFISENSDKVVRDLLDFGVEFDKDEFGNFTLTKEAAHSVNRILHSGGDATGREMEIALCKAVKNNKNITIYENSNVVDLLIENNTCGGVIVFDAETKEYEAIYSNSVIMATGGLGQLYKYTTNPIGATGDGFAICYNSGVVLQDMEFVQFHPTALAFDGDENRFLISEAVRGEGAKLCDEFGNEFMAQYHPKKELAPRDVVARAIYTQMQKNGVSNVYLNAVGIGKEKLLKRFPTIAKKCLSHNIDITKDFIPVAPASHYFMGGIKTNLNSETSVKNLYAIGECASTGLHGANRLASNSLLECVVCAYSVAQNLTGFDVQTSMTGSKYQNIIKRYDNEVEDNPIDISELKLDLRELMWNGVGIFRSEQTMNMAKVGLEKICNKFNRKYKCFSNQEYEFKNMLVTAGLIINSALNRKESRGAHYRSDYMNTNEICAHSMIVKDKGELCFVN